LRLDRAPFQVLARDSEPELIAGIRIGISKAIDEPWRYGLKGSRFVSKPFSE
jgi:DNA-3-methyladenine glycosylase